MKVFFKKILLATDFSSISRNAGDYALYLTKICKAELCVLHVLDSNSWNIPTYYYLSTKDFDRLAVSQEKIRKEEENTLKEMVDSFDIKVKKIFREGDPAHEIMNTAEELNVDLVILGTHGYKGWKRFALGSVAEYVSRYAHCTVLTVRP